MDPYETAVTRRELIRLGVLAGVAAVWAPRGLLGGWAEAAERAPTPSMTAGPFYPVARPVDRDFDLTRIAGRPGRAQGQVLHVAGRVVTVRGEPVRGARVEIWQANALGRYAHPSDPNPAPLDPAFQGYGEQITDREGRFRFVTVKPGPYAGTDGDIRTPHIHVDVTGHADRRVTQLFFAGEPLNGQDRLLGGVARNREALIAPLLPPPPDAEPGSRLVHWDVVLPRG